MKAFANTAQNVTFLQRLDHAVVAQCYLDVMLILIKIQRAFLATAVAQHVGSQFFKREDQGGFRPCVELWQIAGYINSKLIFPEEIAAIHDFSDKAAEVRAG